MKCYEPWFGWTYWLPIWRRPYCLLPAPLMRAVAAGRWGGRGEVGDGGCPPSDLLAWGHGPPVSGTARGVPVQVIQGLCWGPDLVLTWRGVKQGWDPGPRGRGLESRGRGDGQSRSWGDLTVRGAPWNPTWCRAWATRFSRVITFVSSINFMNITTRTNLWPDVRNTGLLSMTKFTSKDVFLVRSATKNMLP